MLNNSLFPELIEDIKLEDFQVLSLQQIIQLSESLKDGNDIFLDDQDNLSKLKDIILSKLGYLRTHNIDGKKIKSTQTDIYPYHENILNCLNMKDPAEKTKLIIFNILKQEMPTEAVIQIETKKLNIILEQINQVLK